MKNIYYSSKMISLFAGAGMVLGGCQVLSPYEGYYHTDKDGIMIENVTPLKKGEGRVILEGKVAKDKLTATSNKLVPSDCYGDKGAGAGVTMRDSLQEKKYLFDKSNNPCAGAKIVFDGNLKVNQRAGLHKYKIDFLDRYSKNPIAKEQKSLSPIIGFGVNPEFPEEFAVQPQSNLDLADESKHLIATELVEGIAIDRPRGEFEKTINPRHALQQGNRVEGFHDKVSGMQFQEEYSEIEKDAEKLLAHYRSVNRKGASKLLENQQKMIERLVAQLRNRDREDLSNSSRQTELADRVTQLQAILDAEKTLYSQEKRKLRRNLEEISQKAQDEETEGRLLRQKYSEEEGKYKERILMLGKDLRFAELKAGEARQQLVLEAARKIAEAEILAQEANTAKQHAYERKAAQLIIEANDLSAQAEQLGGRGYQIVLPTLDRGGMERFSLGVDGNMSDEELKHLIANQGGVYGQGDVSYDEVAYGDEINEENLASGSESYPAVENEKVVIRKHNSTLKGVFEDAFSYMEPKIGKWELIWQLNGDNIAIGEEDWTVVAESTFGEFLAYVKQKVKADYGVDLKFRRFDENHLFMITD